MEETKEEIEEQYKTLLMAILRQAMDDYIKLQSPIYRKKKYLQEAFDAAVSMFFDDTYRFLYIKRKDGDNMSLTDLLSIFVNDKRMDINKLRQHLISESKKFWENKLLNVIEVPDTYIYDGHVYKIQHLDDSDSYEIHFIEKTIAINKDSKNSDNQQLFIKAAIEILLYHEDIPITGKNLEKLYKGFYRMIKVNSCFLAH